MAVKAEGSLAATFMTVVLRSRHCTLVRLGLELLLPGALPAAAPLWLLSRCGSGIRGILVRDDVLLKVSKCHLVGEIERRILEVLEWRQFDSANGGAIQACRTINPTGR